MICATVMLLSFTGIQKKMSKINCVNKVGFTLHKHNLKSLVDNRKYFRMPSLCENRVNYNVKISGRVTNE